VTPEINLSKLTVAEKDTLILSLLPLVGWLQAALARIAELEARLAKLERPSKTLDSSSLPPSPGQKPDRPAGARPPGPSRPGVGRTVHPDPDCVVDATLDACLHCAAAFPVEQQRAQQVYDRIELPPIRPDVTRVRLLR
jgi:transposase